MSSILKPDLITPLCKGKIEIIQVSSNIYNIIISPLEKGFGITLGNALRRILLSCITGCAITSVKIDGVLHEYCSVPGIKEDVVEIIMNLKRVIPSILTEQKSKTVKVSVQGPTTLTARELEIDDVEIVNPDQKICTIAKDTNFSMDVTFENGRGMKTTKDVQNSSDDTIGRIMIDAVFNPVKLVAMDVQETRVGQTIGYDKLIMTIHTNGTIDIKYALDFAAKTLRDQIKPCVFFEDEELESTQKRSKLTFDPVLLKRIDTLDLSVRSVNCMRSIGIVYIGDIVIKSDSEILKTANFGKKSLNEIKSQLKNLGLTLNMVVPDWPPKTDIQELLKEHIQQQNNFSQVN